MYHYMIADKYANAVPTGISHALHFSSLAHTGYYID